MRNGGERGQGWTEGAGLPRVGGPGEGPGGVGRSAPAAGAERGRPELCKQSRIDEVQADGALTRLYTYDRGTWAPTRFGAHPFLDEAKVAAEGKARDYHCRRPWYAAELAAP